MSHDDAEQFLSDLAEAATVLPLDVSVTFRALRGVSLYQLGFWDALIWATAAKHAAKVVYSEDFQHNREIEGVRFVNPFAVGESR